MVKIQVLGSITLEHGHIQTIGWDLVHFGEQFPRPRNRVLLEVIAKRPVAEHLEHRVVIGVDTYLLQVVVLTAHTQTLLRIGYARVLDGLVSEKPILERSHSAVDEHKRWIALHNHRCGRNNDVPFGLEKIQKFAANFFRGHLLHNSREFIPLRAWNMHSRLNSA